MSRPWTPSSKHGMIPNYDKKCWKKSKNFNIRKKSENFETTYKNLEKYGSFSEFRTSTEKSVMLATLQKRAGYSLTRYDNFETPYKNLEKYGSFSKFRTSTEKSVMLATLRRYALKWYSDYFYNFFFAEKDLLLRMETTVWCAIYGCITAL